MQIVISGYGKMGHMVEAELQRRGIRLALATEDVRSVDAELAAQSVCIDFTTPQAFRENYTFLAASFKAVVVGTTGWNDIKDQVVECFRKAGTTMIYASNFSIGVNVFFALASQAAKLMGEAGGYSSYIEEKHHCHKLDRPSGTAKTLESLVESGMKVKPDMASIRCGEIPGIHTVGFEGPFDRITMTHEAFSREGFAAGAVAAAIRTEKLNGVFDFKDIIFSE